MVLAAFGPAAFTVDVLRTGRAPSCSNGQDDDGDGLADHPADPGCASAESEHEDSPCSNGVDDDGDGSTDFPDDPGCDEAADRHETSSLLPCDDGVDNDGDALVDWPDDPGCADLVVGFENPACDDEVDNDGDGGIDWDGGRGGGEPDPQCVGGPWRERETSEKSCGLGVELLLALLSAMWLRRSMKAGSEVACSDGAD